MTPGSVVAADSDVEGVFVAAVGQACRQLALRHDSVGRGEPHEEGERGWPEKHLVVAHGERARRARARGRCFAVLAFIAFYAVCCAVTWAVFIRRGEGRLEGV